MEVGCGLELRPAPVFRVFRNLWRAGLKRAGGIWSAYLCAVPIFGQSVLILSKVGGISGLSSIPILRVSSLERPGQCAFALPDFSDEHRLLHCLPALL